MLMRIRTRLGLIAVACALAGCGPGNGLTMGRVSGLVTYNGQPVEFGEVLFLPDSEKGNNGVPSMGSIGKDGTYIMSTQESGDGVIAGYHKVGIRALDATKVSKDDTPTLDPTVAAGKDLMANRLSKRKAQAGRREQEPGEGRCPHGQLQWQRLSVPRSRETGQSRDLRNQGPDISTGSNRVNFAIAEDGSVKVTSRSLGRRTEVARFQPDSDPGIPVTISGAIPGGHHLARLRRLRIVLRVVAVLALVGAAVWAVDSWWFRAELGRVRREMDCGPLRAGSRTPRPTRGPLARRAARCSIGSGSASRPAAVMTPLWRPGRGCRRIPPRGTCRGRRGRGAVEAWAALPRPKISLSPPGPARAPRADASQMLANLLLAGGAGRRGPSLDQRAGTWIATRRSCSSGSGRSITTPTRSRRFGTNSRTRRGRRPTTTGCGSGGPTWRSGPDDMPRRPHGSMPAEGCGRPIRRSYAPGSTGPWRPIGLTRSSEPCRCSRPTPSLGPRSPRYAARIADVRGDARAEQLALEERVEHEPGDARARAIGRAGSAVGRNRGRGPVPAQEI